MEMLLTDDGHAKVQHRRYQKHQETNHRRNNKNNRNITDRTSRQVRKGQMKVKHAHSGSRKRKTSLVVAALVATSVAKVVVVAAVVAVFVIAAGTDEIKKTKPTSPNYFWNENRNDGGGRMPEKSLGERYEKQQETKQMTRWFSYLSRSFYVSAFSAPTLSTRRGPRSSPVTEATWQLSLSISSSENEKEKLSTSYFRIRPCRFSDLKEVSQIITDSFYTKPSQKPWKGILKLSELNRLQQNFPYSKDAECHEMFVAVQQKTTASTSNDDDDDDDDEIVVGFVDIDGRSLPPDKVKLYPPRPYLSDLSVHENFRRKGIARALVERCHEYLVDFYYNRDNVHGNDENNNEEKSVGVYIRVAKDNDAAVRLYTQPSTSSMSNSSSTTSCFDYKILREEKDKTLGDVWLLHKNLMPSSNE